MTAMTPPRITKPCPKCGQTKAVELFPPRGRQCRQCVASHRKEYYEKNRERFTFYKKKYDEKNRERLAFYNKKYYAKNRAKENRAAHRYYWQVERERNAIVAERIRTAKAQVRRELRRELRGPFEMKYALNAVAALMRSLRDVRRGSAPLDVAIAAGLPVQHVRENLEKIKAAAARNLASARAAQKSRRESETVARSATAQENAEAVIAAPA
jgi:hypothetical protein